MWEWWRNKDCLLCYLTKMAITKLCLCIQRCVAAYMSNTSVPILCISLVICIVYNAGLYNKDVWEYLTSRPGLLLPPALQLWSLFTYWAVENNLCWVVFDVLMITFLAMIVEPLWGRTEMVKFFFMMTIGASCLSTVDFLMLFSITRNEQYLFSLHLQGMLGYFGACAVTMKQILPNHCIVKSRIGNLTTNAPPLLVAVIMQILCLAQVIESRYHMLWMSGCVLAWVYLRFWQYHGAGRYGDMADSLSVDSFFPPFMQPSIRKLLSQPFQCGVYLGVFPPYTPPKSSRGALISMPLPGTSEDVAWRQIAIKALSYRLADIDFFRSPWDYPSQELHVPSTSEPLVQVVTTNDSVEPK